VTDEGDEGELERLADHVRAPRAAAIAGIAFAAIFSAVLVLMRSAVPSDPGEDGTWLASGWQRSRVDVALALLPFAGIAFLWFIGVIRDHLGDREDRFFATVFLGSGLLFVAMMFVGGAVIATLVSIAGDTATSPEVWHFGRQFVFAIMTTYAQRMAAVFTIATTTLAGRLRVLPRWLQIEGYLTALALLLLVSVLPIVELLFPVWVLLVSIQILVAGRRALRAPAAAG
jgi:hypothetical protein